MTVPRWEAAGLDLTPAIPHHRPAGVTVRGPRAAVLVPELARSLAWWLLGYVGDRTGPADPDVLEHVGVVQLDTLQADGLVEAVRQLAGRRPTHLEVGVGGRRGRRRRVGSGAGRLARTFGVRFFRRCFFCRR